MPVPKIFKRFTSKNAFKASLNGNPAPDVPVDRKKDASSRTLVMAAVVPASPDNLAEAWAAAYKELPQAQGGEKSLNRIGASIIDGFACA